MHLLINAILISLIGFVTALTSGCSGSEFTGSSKDSFAAVGDRNDASDDTDQNNRRRRGQDGGDSDAGGSDAGDGDVLGNEGEGDAADAGGADEDGENADGALGEDDEETSKKKPKLSLTGSIPKKLCSENGIEANGTSLMSASAVKVWAVPSGEELMELSPEALDDLRDQLRSGGSFSLTQDLEDKIPTGTQRVVLADAAFPYPGDVDEEGEADDRIGQGQGAIVYADLNVSEGSSLSQSGNLNAVTEAIFVGSEEMEPGCTDQNSPLIVDFSGRGVQLSSPEDGVRFDLEGNGKLRKISWTTSKLNAFLALDKNGDRMIDNGNELFGNHSVGPDAEKSDNGFLALTKYDDNQDGVIDQNDKVYGDLVLWTDLNRNGQSDLGELRTLRQAKVKSFDLAYTTGMNMDRHGNEIRERAFATMESGSQLPVYDLWFLTMTERASLWSKLLNWVTNLI